MQSMPEIPLDSELIMFRQPLRSNDVMSFSCFRFASPRLVICQQSARHKCFRCCNDPRPSIPLSWRPKQPFMFNWTKFSIEASSFSPCPFICSHDLISSLSNPFSAAIYRNTSSVIPWHPLKLSSVKCLFIFADGEQYDG